MAKQGTMPFEDAKSMLDDYTAKMDVGAGAAVYEFRSGAPPAGGPVGDPSGTLLVSFAFPVPAYNPATDANPGAQAVANTIPSATPAAAGTIGHVLRRDRDGRVTFMGVASTTPDDGDVLVNTLTVELGVDWDFPSALIDLAEGPLATTV